MSASLPSSGAKAGAAVGFLAMAIVGWKFAEPARDAIQASDSDEPVATKTLKRHEWSASHGPPEYVRERLRAIRAAGSSSEKLRSTIELANSLPIADLAAWLDHRWFDVGEGFDATLFEKIAMQRWMEEDPEGHAAWCIKNETDPEIFDAWAKDDPQRILAFFQKNPNREFEMGALQEIAKNHPDVALARIREIIAKGTNTHQGGDSYYVQAVLDEIAKKDPAALEAAMTSLPAKWQKTVESLFVGRRLEADFAGEIRSLWERPDGFSLFQGADSSTRTKLLDELANLPASWKAGIALNPNNFIDSNNVEKWLNADLTGNGFPADLANSIKTNALQYLANRKPEVAIQQLATLDLDNSQRKNVITTIFGNFGNWKSEKAESLLAMLGSDEDRQIARSQIEANPATDPFAESSQAKIEKPADWLATAATIDPQKGDTYQLFSLLGAWDKDKLAEVSHGFSSLPDEQKARVATVLAVGNQYSSSSSDMDPTLRGEAINYLIAHPPEEAKPGANDTTYLASNHAVLWSQKDPAAASAWVQTLPAGDARLWAQKNLAANWSQYDPNAASQWVKSLPADARGEVEKFMKNSSSN